MVVGAGLRAIGGGGGGERGEEKGGGGGEEKGEGGKGRQASLIQYILVI